MKIAQQYTYEYFHHYLLIYLHQNHRADPNQIQRNYPLKPIFTNYMQYYIQYRSYQVYIMIHPPKIYLIKLNRMLYHAQLVQLMHHYPK